MAKDESSLLFGCHIAVGNVTPGFHVREMSGVEEVNLLCPCCIIVIPCHCSVMVPWFSEVGWEEHGAGNTYRSLGGGELTMSTSCCPCCILLIVSL